MFLTARPGDEHPDRIASPLIDEMRRRGVRPVANLSAMGVETRDDISLRRVEQYLEDSGLASRTYAQTRRTSEDRPLRGDATGWRLCENPNQEVGDASVQPTKATAAISQIPQPAGWGSFTVSLKHCEGQGLERTPTCRLEDSEDASSVVL